MPTASMDTKKYRISQDALNYLASDLDVEGTEAILYHKLDRAYHSLKAEFFGYATVKLSNNEVQTLKHLIGLRLSGSEYCSISNKELLQKTLTFL